MSAGIRRVGAILNYKEKRLVLWEIKILKFDLPVGPRSCVVTFPLIKTQDVFAHDICRKSHWQPSTSMHNEKYPSKDRWSSILVGKVLFWESFHYINCIECILLYLRLELQPFVHNLWEMSAMFFAHTIIYRDVFGFVWNNVYGVTIASKKLRYHNSFSNSLVYLPLNFSAASSCLVPFDFHYVY